MTRRTFAAGTAPKEMLLKLRMLLSVAYTSAHFTPSVDTLSVKAFAGNSQSTTTSLNRFSPPRSTVMATGPDGFNALACKRNAGANKDAWRPNRGTTTNTQNVLELPSTAMLAPCAAASAELLALMAPHHCAHGTH